MISWIWHQKQSLQKKKIDQLDVIKILGICYIKGHCYGLNVCVSSKSVCWSKPIRWWYCRRWAFGTWWGHEWDQYPYRDSFPPHTRTQQEDAIYEPGSGPSPDTEAAWCLKSLISDFPASRVVKYKFLLFVNYSLYGNFVTIVQMD